MIEELYTSFFDKLTRYCNAVTRGDRDAAEDLVQETFLRAMTHAGVVDGLSRGQCWSWLTKTARNLWIDRARKLSRESLAEWEELDQNAHEEDLTEMEAAQFIALLPEEERALFVMRHFEGYNASELGRIFSLPSSTVRTRLASARARLRKYLKQ